MWTSNDRLVVWLIHWKALMALLLAENHQIQGVVQLVEVPPFIADSIEGFYIQKDETEDANLQDQGRKVMLLSSHSGNRNDCTSNDCKNLDVQSFRFPE